MENSAFGFTGLQSGRQSCLKRMSLTVSGWQQFLQLKHRTKDRYDLVHSFFRPALARRETMVVLNV